MGTARKTGGVYRRGETWWIHYRVDGERYYESADTRDERTARSFLAQRRREIAEGTWKAPGAAETAAAPEALTFRAWAATWLARRREAGVRTVGHEERRIDRWWLPAVGDLALSAITRSHVRDVVATMQRTKSASTEKPYSPREVLHVYAALRTCLADAVVDEALEVSPCTLRTRRGELPAKRDSDPTWRESAIYTRAEAEQLISDDRVPIDRRVYYALMILGGLRASEAAGLRWRHYDREAQPLGRILVAVQAEGAETRETKTQRPRRVPVHPTLAALLAEWRMSGFPALFMRHARPDDLVVPSRAGLELARGGRGGARLIDDLRRLELRATGRSRHAMRATYRTLAIEDGAMPVILDLTMWGAPSDVKGGYERFPWAAMCAEVAKLRVALRRSVVVPLRKAANENGPNPGDSRSDSREDRAVSSADSEWSRGESNPNAPSVRTAFQGTSAPGGAIERGAQGPQIAGDRDRPTQSVTHVTDADLVAALRARASTATGELRDALERAAHTLDEKTLPFR